MNKWINAVNGASIALMLAAFFYGDRLFQVGLILFLLGIIGGEKNG